MALNTSDGVAEIVAIELVRVCPTSEAIERVKDYQRQISKEIGSVYAWDGSPEFEEAILQRKEKSLDLLIARSVCEFENAKALWQRAEAEAQRGDQGYAHALKLQLMSGPLAFELVTDNALSLSDATTVFHHVFGKMDDWNDLAGAALANPKARDLIEAYVGEKKLFSGQSEKFRLCAWNSITKNPCINEERDYDDSPDLTAWNIKKGVEKIFQDAPVTKSWYFILDSLLTALNPKVHSFHKFDFNAMIEKWAPDPTLEEAERSEFDPWFPMLIANFLAKFGTDYEPAKSIKSISQAVKHPDLYAKAAFLGNTKFQDRDIRVAFEESLVVSPEIEFLLENSSLYYDPDVYLRVRRHLIEVGDSDLVDLLDRNMHFYASPRRIVLGKRESRAIAKESQLEALSEIREKVGAIDQTRDVLERRLINLEDGLKSMFKAALFWALLIAVFVIFK